MSAAPTETLGRFALVLLARIRPPADQLRESFDQEALEQLADSMATEGLHQAIGLRGPFDGDEWEIIYGHRRFLAAGMLGWQEIKASLYPADFDPLLASVHENLMRADLSPVEEARICGRLRERGYSTPSIGRLLRRSQAWVAVRLGLLDAPADVQAAVHDRRVPIGVAWALAAIDHEGYRGELLHEAERTGATVAVANVWAAEYAANRDRYVANQEFITDLIRRSQETANFTDCESCAGRVPWAEIYTLKLCRRCRADVDAALRVPAPSPPART